MSLLRWTSKSSTKLAGELVAQGFEVSSRSVLRYLGFLGYSMQAPSKANEGTQHPDRDGQFTYLNSLAEEFIADNEGWVNVGDTADTSEFAVESIRRWWNQMGRARFAEATRLLITADAGGSNGHRVRAWKAELAVLAAETGLDITVCHYPPGTSKLNRIEHRMFSFIPMNWRGRPLTNIRTVIELISATTTSTGLSIQAGHDTGW